MRPNAPLLAALALPLAALVTPNLHEACVLTDLTLEGVEDMRTAARTLVEMGAGAALVKGGRQKGARGKLIWHTGTFNGLHDNW